MHSQEVDLSIKIKMYANVHLLDLLVCFHYILNPTRMFDIDNVTVNVVKSRTLVYCEKGINKQHIPRRTFGPFFLLLYVPCQQLWSLWDGQFMLRCRMAGITESAMVAYTHKYAEV